MGEDEEQALLIGSAITTLTEPASTRILSQAPSQRAGEEHSVMISRMVGNSANAMSLLEPYHHAPVWDMEKRSDVYVMKNGDTIDTVWLDIAAQRNTLQREIDGSLAHWVLVNKNEDDIDGWRVASEQAIQIQFDFVYEDGQRIIEYQTVDKEASFLLEMTENFELFEIYLDEAPAEINFGSDRLTIGPLPGGKHTITIAELAVGIKDWKRYE
jgi:hypothetical protein